MAYSDGLPRKLPKEQQNRRCQVLDMDGERCRRLARYEAYIFEDPKTRWRWVAVEMCQKCHENRA